MAICIDEEALKKMACAFFHKKKFPQHLKDDAVQEYVVRAALAQMDSGISDPAFLRVCGQRGMMMFIRREYRHQKKINHMRQTLRDMGFYGDV